MTTEAQYIANRLSEAQKRTMLWPQRVESLPVMVWSYAATMQVLMRHGLLGQRHGGWYELSPLGQAVRDYLKGQPC